MTNEQLIKEIEQDNQQAAKTTYDDLYLATLNILTSFLLNKDKK